MKAPASGPPTRLRLPSSGQGDAEAEEALGAGGERGGFADEDGLGGAMVGDAHFDGSGGGPGGEVAGGFERVGEVGGELGTGVGEGEVARAADVEDADDGKGGGGVGREGIEAEGVFE